MLINLFIIGYNKWNTSASDLSANPRGLYVNGDISGNNIFSSSLTLPKLEIKDQKILSRSSDTTANIIIDPSNGYTNLMGDVRVQTPTKDTNPATKQYVDQTATGLKVQEHVSLATTVNIAFPFNGNITVDGSANPIVGSRILVKEQSDKTQNGVWIVVNPGAWTRSTDFASGTNVSNFYVFVDNGSANLHTGWVVDGSNVIVGTSDITFNQFSSTGDIQPGNGLTKAGETLNIIACDGNGHYTINGGSINGTTIGATSEASGKFTTLEATTSITGTLTTAAQPNITSVGTLGSVDIDGGAIDDTPIGSGTASTGKFTTLEATTSITGTLSTAAQPNITSVGTLGSVDIDGGAIDGTPIGSGTANTGKFTTLEATTSIKGTLSTAAQPNITSLGTLGSVDIDGGAIDGTPIGSGTANTGKFTTLEATTSIKKLTSTNPDEGLKIYYTNSTRTTCELSAAANDTRHGSLVLRKDASPSIPGIPNSNVQVSLVGDPGTAASALVPPYNFIMGDLCLGWGNGEYYEGPNPPTAQEPPEGKLDVQGNIMCRGGEMKWAYGTNSTDYSTSIKQVSLTQLQIDWSGTGSASNAELSLLPSGGNVGIGTNAPQAKLQVVGDISCNTIKDASGNTGSSGQVLSSTGTGLSWVNTTEHGPWSTSGSDIYYNATGGKVGIGKTDPSGALDVSGTVTATSFNATSDLNKKENIDTILNATEKMTLLRGVSYNLKSDKNKKKHYGVIAQELEKIFPDMVNGEEGNKSVAYMEIIGVLIETVKDLNKRIENLEQSSNN